MELPERRAAGGIFRCETGADGGVVWVSAKAALQAPLPGKQPVRLRCLCFWEAEGAFSAALVVGFLLPGRSLSSFKGLCRLFVYLLQLLLSILNFLPPVPLI